MNATTVRAKVVLAELETLGLTVADLLSAAGSGSPHGPAVPTLAEYLPSVRELYAPRTRRTYNSYWRLAEEMIGDLPLDEVTADHVAAIAEEAARRAQQRRAGSDGRASRESTIAAVRGGWVGLLVAGVTRRARGSATVAPLPRRALSKHPRRSVFV